MSEVYQNPKYYELAFSFRDSAAEVNVFETLIRQYSRIPVTQMLELGCGPAPHLAAITCRGYRYVGLDLSPPMLAYAQQKADQLQAPARFHLASMIDFRLTEPVDFAFLLLGSLYVSNTAELLSHFDAVSRALKRGGLYLLDWCVQFALPAERAEAWEMSRADLTVRTTYQLKPINPGEQTVEETLTLEAEDAGMPVVLREVGIRREIYPQEFLLLMASRSDLEFVGWWNNWDLTQPLDGASLINRPIIVVREV